MYQPPSGTPYLIVSITGHIYKVVLQVPYTVTELINTGPYTGTNPQYNPGIVEQAYFEQAEDFLLIQAGDYVTLPLIWDNSTLRRSIGITNTAVAPGTPGVNEIPAAGPMCYYMNRLWFAFGRTYGAGDIVGGNSGTVAYGFRDAVLNVTENPLVVGGDYFTVPTNAGNIRALKYGANLDTALGQGPLYIFTRKQIYALDVPVTRTDWIDATTDNRPLQRVVGFNNGAVNDRSIVAVNGDLLFQSLEPSIRSLIAAIRYYQQWGNTPISANEDRILKYNDRSLLHMATGTEFANRLLQSALPEQTDFGVIHKAIIPLDFDPIQSFGKEHLPAWEGHWEGLDIFQLLNVDYNGLERAFALSKSRENNDLQLWEITSIERSDFTLTEDFRITMMAETPAYTFDRPHKWKELKGGEIWIDRAYGRVTVQVYYRPDADPCWVLWHQHEFCVARNSTEDVSNPEVYPEEGYSEGYRWPIVLPTPPGPCDSMHVRPTNKGYQFQIKIVVIGWARIRSILVYATELPKSIYEGLSTQNTPPDPQAMNV